MSQSSRRLRIAFLHPDLGIGGAERLVVDAALGLQQLGHSIDLYTSYHDPNHCFEETRDGTLTVHHIVPPFPRSLKGKFHILFAHLRQLHLTTHLLSPQAPQYDLYFVDQLSTCIPFLRLLGKTRVVFYCHFPDKLLATGATAEEKRAKDLGWLKCIYRVPMDWLEEVTTKQADVILANSLFTVGMFKKYFPSIPQTPRVVYPGINLSAYEPQVDGSDSDIVAVAPDQPTFLSLNRFEMKKNAMLALQAFALLKNRSKDLGPLRLVLAGGYDPRVEDNVNTLRQLVDCAKSLSLTYTIKSPSALAPQASSLNSNSTNPEILFLLNFTMAQRTALLLNPSTLALLYTPTNEHFGIVPVEAMACGLPVLACDSGGPTESVVSSSQNQSDERTGWLKAPDSEVWADVLSELVSLGPEERKAISERAKKRVKNMFTMDAMARSLEEALTEAYEMGKVDTESLGWVRTMVMMLVGFLLAYLVGPFVLPSSG
ncbi:unnamed protein product [Cyclocybe aegerita]|uniref:Alpha-1,3/1,6-mannosyltransferase ALG2 n=1 Tax=Cyclocybe aegerita TaxID=1973307 RepID=A0A8S0XFE6_CYCAE|nr:unnamed protein product [Cyclocybe aegerita]